MALILHGGSIKTAFGYVPSSRPDTPSVLRQASYAQNLPLMGPDADPEGWRTYDPVVVRGVMFKTRPVQVACAVSTSVLSILTDG